MLVNRNTLKEFWKIQTFLNVWESLLVDVKISGCWGIKRILRTTLLPNELFFYILLIWYQYDYISFSTHNNAIPLNAHTNNWKIINIILIWLRIFYAEVVIFVTLVAMLKLKSKTNTSGKASSNTCYSHAITD